MKRLVTALACLAMLAFSGCAGGILGGTCNSGCNDRPSLFGSGGLFADGPVRQFMRGDACDTCNAAAGQVFPQQGPTCDACGTIVNGGGYSLPPAPVASQPTDSGTSLGPIDNSSILPGYLGTDLTMPPAGIN